MTIDDDQRPMFDTVDELHTIVAEQKADLRRRVLEISVEMGVGVRGPEDLVTLDRKLAFAYRQIEINAAQAEQNMRTYDGKPADA